MEDESGMSENSFNMGFDDGDDDGFGSGGDDAMWSDDENGASFAEEGPREEFVVLTQEQATESMNDVISDLSGLLDVSPLMASMLLRLNNWNKEKVSLAFLENRDKVLADLGLDVLEKDGNAGVDPEEEVECRICVEDLPAKETHANGCGHAFCLECWTDFLQEKLKHGKQAIRTTCPAYKCCAIVPDTLFSRLLPDARNKFNTLLVRSYVEDNRLLRWCGAPRCNFIIKARGGSVGTVKCQCGYSFCFKCNEESHAPATCSHLRQWLEKCKNESETANWIIANTKTCPKCHVRIEKNQGCNHMTCRSCKHEFCWVCNGNWADHGNHTGGFYKCNKFDPKAAAKEGKDGKLSSREAAKRELDRYLHYYQRFHNHDQARKFADRVQKQTEQRMNDLQEHSQDSSWMDVQFLMQASKQVFECRQVLKFTYVFAYYLPDGPEKTLFEYLQQQLEINTEKLSELSEQPTEKLVQSEVVNHTRVTKQFMDNLLEGVANGLTS